MKLGLTLKTIMKTLPENHHAQQKMVKNANFHSFIWGKSTKLVPRILKIQMKIGVQPEQTQTENMLEEVDIMDSVGIVVH